MKETKVSIIIPVYNVSEFIIECLKSIVNQTYTNFEVILIDDYSTDDSHEKIIKFTNEQNLFKVFRNSKNMGVSSTRNIGIKKSNGDYICFIDPDDYISENYIESMVNTQEKNINNLVFSKINNIHNNKNTSDQTLFSQLNNTNKFSSLLIYGYSWGKLFKTDILKSNNICFSEDISCTEDTLFCIKYAQHVGKIVLDRKATYFYRSHPQSTLNSMTFKNRLDDLIARKRILSLNICEQNFQLLAYRLYMSKLEIEIIRYILIKKNREFLLYLYSKERPLTFCDFKKLSNSRKISHTIFVVICPIFLLIRKLLLQYK